MRSFSFLMVVPLIVMMVVIVMTTAMTRPTTWSLTRCTEKKQCESLPQQGNHLYSIWHWSLERRQGFNIWLYCCLGLSAKCWLMGEWSGWIPLRQKEYNLKDRMKKYLFCISAAWTWPWAKTMLRVQTGNALLWVFLNSWHLLFLSNPIPIIAWACH